MAGAGKATYKRTDFVRQAIAPDFLPDFTDRLPGSLQRWVLIGLLQLSKWRWNAFPKQALPQRPQGIDHPCIACKFTEKNEPAIVAVRDFFIIDQRAFHFKHFLKHTHVVVLTFNGM